MQAWLKWMAAWGVAGVMVSAASAQIQIQVQVQPLPAAPAQVQIRGGAIVSTTPMGLAPNRLAASDAIFVGRVVALEPMDIEVAAAKGQPKVSYRIAVVQVSETIRGLKKDAKMARVGFVVGGNGQQVGGFGNGGIQPAIQPGGAIMRRPYLPSMNLQVGQDGLFFLAKHPTESFYLGPTYQNFVNRQNNVNFDNEVKAAKQVSKIIDNPTASLKSMDKEERYTAAAVLISKYRSNSTGMAMKQVPIDAAESKLILKALAEGDWTSGRYNATVPTAPVLFNQLGISANDGYKLGKVRTQQDIMRAMQSWVHDNADKYVIKKLVADPNAKVLPPNRVQPRNGPAAVGGFGGGGGVLPVQPPQALPAPKKGN